MERVLDPKLAEDLVSFDGAREPAVVGVKEIDLLVDPAEQLLKGRPTCHVRIPTLGLSELYHRNSRITYVSARQIRP